MGIVLESLARARGMLVLYKVSLRYDNPVARCAHGCSTDPVQKEIAQTIDEVMNTQGTSR